MSRWIPKFLPASVLSLSAVFARETALRKVKAAEDAWNSRDRERVAVAHRVDRSSM